MKAASVLLAAVVFLAGCGKEERNEAVQLTKVLNEKRAGYAKADAVEGEFVNNARAWCEGITANGAGRGEELDQNATVASELAKSAVTVSNELGRVRQALSDQRLNKEFPQNVRNDLLTTLMNRQRQLQDIRALLEKSAPQFKQFRTSRQYKGDTYPGEISSLDAILKGYHPPKDAVGDALKALDDKYHLNR